MYMNSVKKWHNLKNATDVVNCLHQCTAILTLGTIPSSPPRQTGAGVVEPAQCITNASIFAGIRTTRIDFCNQQISYSQCVFSAITSTAKTTADLCKRHHHSIFFQECSIGCLLNHGSPASGVRGLKREVLSCAPLHRFRTADSTNNC